MLFFLNFVDVLSFLFCTLKQNVLPFEGLHSAPLWPLASNLPQTVMSFGGDSRFVLDGGGFDQFFF